MLRAIGQTLFVGCVVGLCLAAAPAEGGEGPLVRVEPPRLLPARVNWTPLLRKGRVVQTSFPAEGGQIRRLPPIDGKAGGSPGPNFPPASAAPAAESPQHPLVGESLFGAPPLPAEARSLKPAVPAIPAPPPRILDPRLFPPLPSAPPPSRPIRLPPPTPVHLTRTRSAAVEAAAAEADARVRRGFELAEHRAVFAARRQVDEALRIVATALDADRQTVEHGAALNRGLRAMAEADQFLPRGRTVAADIRTADLVVGHETPVLKNSDPSRVTCWQARAAYLDYARSEMARAMDGEFAGSMALLALGKLQAAPAGLGAEGSNADWDKAAMLHRAALDVSPHNVLAANDLAVLLADRGELHEARRLLEAVARQSRLAEAWHNLASVCHRMGDGRSGAQAAEQARVCARERASGEPARSARVMWLAPGQFGPPASDAPAEVADGTSAQPEGSDEGSLAGWPAWRLLRRK